MFCLHRRLIVTWRPTKKAGLSSPASPTTTPRTGWKTAVTIGTTEHPPSVRPQTPQKTQTWSRPPFGWSSAPSSRSHAATTRATRHCCTQRVGVWADRHSAPRWRAMATSEMEKSGPVTSASGSVTCSMAASTKIPPGLVGPSATGVSSRGTRSASGATGIGETALWWRSEVLEGAATAFMPRTALESLKLTKRRLFTISTKTPWTKKTSVTMATMHGRSTRPSCPLILSTCGCARIKSRVHFVNTQCCRLILEYTARGKLGYRGWV